jgi:hypothetical protein
MDANLVLGTQQHHLGSMSSQANSHQKDPAFQEMGAHFGPSATASSTLGTRAMSKDLERIVTADKTTSKQASDKSTNTSGKTHDQVQDLAEIDVCTLNANEAYVVHHSGRHIAQQIAPRDIAPPIQHGSTEESRGGPWPIAKQVKKATKSYVDPSETSSTAVTKGSGEISRRH